MLSVLSLNLVKTKPALQPQFLSIIPNHVFSTSSQSSNSLSVYQPNSSENLHPLNQTRQTQKHPSLVYAHHLLRTIIPDLIPITTLHCLLLRLGSLTSHHTCTSLLVLYAKSQCLASSWKLFEEMPTRDVISWNAMINACVCNKQFHLALDLFRDTRKEESCIDSTTMVIIISALSRINDLEKGRMVHGLSLKYGVGSDCFLCNALIDMYAKCGELACAESVFECMEFRDTSSWNSMMSGCAFNNYPEKSLKYFKVMDLSCDDVRADNLSILCTISACSTLGELHYGQSSHAFAIKMGFEGTTYSSIENALISLYSQYGEIEDAVSLFRRLIHKDDVVSWNSMICGFATKGMVLEACSLLREMQLTSYVHPDLVTLISIVPLCAELKLFNEGRSVHGFVIRRAMRLDLSLKNSILDMYCKCHDIKSAEMLFISIPERDLITWNTMIAGYSQSKHLIEAQGLFRELLYRGLPCSALTLLSVLSSCDSPEELQFGKSIHNLQLKMGFTNNFLTINALMFMYISCGDLTACLTLLWSILVTADVVSWNTAIVGCAQNGYLYETLEAFNQMQRSSHVNPDTITLVSVLSACGDLQLVPTGRSVHGFTLKTSMESDLRVSNSLITMYSRCEDIDSAMLVFSTISLPNLCSWNCMISGFAQNKDGERALELFHHLEYEPNEFTIVSVLSACTHIVSLRHGKQAHNYVIRFGLQHNLFILTALIDMYSKCGRLDRAIQIFETSEQKSVASWNCMISAFGFHGQGREATKLFTQMCASGTRPTKSTFISLLSACSHTGLVEEGCLYYKLMSTEFGVEPTTEHHVCLVDMLGRGGRLVEAYKFVERIQPRAEIGVWGALLSACKYHGDVRMGKQIAERIFNIDPGNSGYYVSLFNIYAADGRWNDAMDVRRVIEDRMLRKPPGYSLLDLCSV